MAILMRWQSCMPHRPDSIPTQLQRQILCEIFHDCQPQCGHWTLHYCGKPHSSTCQDKKIVQNAHVTIIHVQTPGWSLGYSFTFAGPDCFIIIIGALPVVDMSAHYEVLCDLKAVCLWCAQPRVHCSHPRPVLAGQSSEQCWAVALLSCWDRSNTRQWSWHSYATHNRLMPSNFLMTWLTSNFITCHQELCWWCKELLPTDHFNGRLPTQTLNTEVTSL